jgi:AcrR family transcriptional regulator
MAAAPESNASPLGRLPSGRHGLPRDFVAANHRERLIAACLQEVAKQGYGATTVATVIKSAAVSRRTFYEHFDSMEDCFLASYDLVIAHMRARIEAAFEAEDEWGEKVRAGLAVFLRFFAEEPQLGRFCMVESLAAGRVVADHHRAEVASFAPLLEAGRDPKRPGEPPPDTEDAVISGIATLVTMRIAAGRAEQLEELLPSTVATALTPFLGGAEAERIARQSLSKR